MSKGSRNRQQAREKLARRRAEEARRRQRRVWAAATGTAAVLAAAAVGITLAVAGGAGSPAATGGSPQLKLAALSTLGPLRAAPPPGPAGPEGVPMPAAAPLAGTATVAQGQDVDHIGCQRSEQTLFHIHAHLTVFVNGSARQIPAGIGIQREVGTPLIAPEHITFPDGL